MDSNRELDQTTQHRPNNQGSYSEGNAPGELGRNGHNGLAKIKGDAALEQAYNLTELGNSERFLRNHGENVRYCYPWRKWLIWTGKNWERDERGQRYKLAKETVRGIYEEAARAPDTHLRQKLAKHAANSEAEARIQAMLKLSQSEVPVLPGELDADPWLLGVQNGTVNLRTGELLDHRREDLITKLSPVEYDPDAEAEPWEAFLARVLPSAALRQFVQRLAGYALTGAVSEQILPFLYGSGANGKTTFLNALLEVAGDYGQQAAPDLLLAKRGSHPTELADLFGARLVASVEVEDGRRLAEGLVKQLTGGDRIKARRMKEDFWEFSPMHKILLAANHKPEVRGTDHAIWRRIKLIPFDVTIPKSEQDPRLPEKLRAEMPGILAWAVRGCLDWQREGLGEPDEVVAATEGYRGEMDVLAQWIEERCVVREGTWALFSELYNDYREWAESSGEQAEKKAKFGLHLSKRGLENARGAKNVAIRQGIALRHDGGDDPGPGRSARVNASDGLDAAQGPESANEGHQGDEGVNLASSSGATVNPQIPCKSAGEGEWVNSCGREITINGSNSPREPLTPKAVNNRSPVNSKKPQPQVEGRVFSADNLTDGVGEDLVHGRPQDGVLNAGGAVDNQAENSHRRRLTEDEARRVQDLIADGMAPKLARAEVTGEELEGGEDS
jgi:P4 family phage/plasmid primase-like protien